MRKLDVIAGPVVTRLLGIGHERLHALADKLGAVQVGRYTYYSREAVDAYAAEHARPDTTGMITLVEAGRIAGLTPTRLITYDQTLQPVIYRTGKTTRRYYRPEVVIEFSRERAAERRGRDGRAAKHQNARRDRQP